jgi:hypothetical protein
MRDGRCALASHEMVPVELPNPSSPSRPSLPFVAPPRLRAADGQPRRVGIEIEFAGLDVDEAAALVVELYGGTVESDGRFARLVKRTRLGDFRVELDSTPLKRARYREVLTKMGVSTRVREIVDDALESIARQWIPNEIVAPPITLNLLPQIELLRNALFSSHAHGTKKSILYAFGFQLNPEVPSLDAQSLAAHLQSFILLYDWVVDVSKIDLTRKFSSFIDPYPDEYRHLVLEEDYEPDIDRLVDDYLRWNPTRNRPLDMLPAFALLRPEKVFAASREPDQINPRPTFHYRLPNCLVDDPDWSFSTEWNRWVEVERLAANLPLRRRLSREYLENDLAAHRHDRKIWSKHVQRVIGLPGVGG